MRIRRCAIVFLELRETRAFDLQHLVDGGDGLAATRSWVALAPHLAAEVEINADEAMLLGSFSPSQWTSVKDNDESGLIGSLLSKGLLLSEHGDAVANGRDESLRGIGWHPLAAVAHMFGRWDRVDSVAALDSSGLRTVSDLVQRLGQPPPHFHERGEPRARIALHRPAPSAQSELMDRRTTCRNFDQQRRLSGALLAAMLHRVFAAHGAVEAAPGATIVKKTSPSGGGLHATEAYIVVQHVDGIDAGLYHYHAGEHALEPVAAPTQDDSGLGARCLLMLAGQHWFADAHVLVILAPRFGRSYWKYRNHAKAYRALVLDVGHLSQTLYLTATELGLGAFVTSAINEAAIEREFALDPLAESPLAVCGFGWRDAECRMMEFDPGHRVWPPG